jgi:hypothetical protein
MLASSNANCYQKPTGLRPRLRPDSKPTRVPTSATGRLMRTNRLPTVGLMSAVRVPTSVPTGADRHLKVPTCADLDRRGRRLRGAVPPVPRGFVGTEFAVQGYFEVAVAQLAGWAARVSCRRRSMQPARDPILTPSRAAAARSRDGSGSIKRR